MKSEHRTAHPFAYVEIKVIAHSPRATITRPGLYTWNIAIEYDAALCHYRADEIRTSPNIHSPALAAHANIWLNIYSIYKQILQPHTHILTSQSERDRVSQVQVMRARKAINFSINDCPSQYGQHARGRWWFAFHLSINALRSNHKHHHPHTNMIGNVDELFFFICWATLGCQAM